MMTNKYLNKLRFTSLLALCFIFLVASYSHAGSVKLASKKERAKWGNEWSDRVGAHLEYSFDSSGPDAWDAKQYPTVFVLSLIHI